MRLPRFRPRGAGFVLAIALTVLAAAAPARAAVQIQRVVSPGGIEAWLVENHTLPLIALDVGFHGGSRLDPEGKPGVANFVSGLLDEGAGDIDSQAFQQLLAEKSIKLSFDANRDGFYASLRTLTANRDEAFRLLGLALDKPRFDAEPVARVRAQILTVLAQQDEDPQQVAVKAWYAAAFPDHPYGRPVEGNAASVKAVTRQDLVDYVESYFTRKRMVVSAVGDIDAKSLGELLDRTFGALAASGPEPDLGKPAAERPSGLKVIRKDNPQTIMLFGEAGLLRKDPDFIPAYVMNYILGGGGFSSRLMEEVRVKRGLAYNVSTQLMPYDFAGIVLGYVGTENQRAGQSLALIRAEFQRLRDEGVTDKELADAKTYLTGAYPLRFDSNDDIADELLGIQMEDLGIDYVNTRNDKIRAVTLADIQRVAKRILDPKGLLVVAVGEPANLEQGGAPQPEPEAAGAKPAAPQVQGTGGAEGTAPSGPEMPAGPGAGPIQ